MMTATAEVPDWLRCADQAVGWARLMLQRDFAVVIDCETTDLPGAVCEVAVVDTSGRVLLNSLVHPCQPITRAAGKVHNITEEMVAAAPTFPELFDDILRVTAGRRVLAYNAAFDRQCLLADAQRHRRNAEHLEDLDTWGCVMRARSAWVGTPDHFYRLEAGHRALGDARAALNVLQTIAADSRLYPWPVSGPTCGSRSNDTAVGDIAIDWPGAVSVT